MQFPILYGRTSAGAIQTWQIIVDNDEFFTVSGQLNGKQVVSSRTKCEPKNVGKKNATTSSAQALLEAAAKHKKKLEKGYYENVADIDKQQYFEPMLAKSFKDVPVKFPVYCQPKLDGHRCIATKDGLFSRNGKPILSVPHIMDSLRPHFDKNPEAIFDGELYNHLFKNDFNAIISLTKKTKPDQDDLDKSARYIQYHIYDFPVNMKFGDRWEALKSLGIENKYVHLVKTFVAESQDALDSFYSEFLECGYEGQMVRIDNIYENKRSKYLLKRKEFIDEEFEILDILTGKGSRSDMMGKVLLRIGDKEFEAGARGSHEYFTQLLEDRDNLVGKLATIRYQNLTPDGVPRFPIMVAIRDYE